MNKNIKFDVSMYENDIKNLNFEFKELIKRKSVQKAYKKYLKEVKKYECIKHKISR